MGDLLGLVAILGAFGIPALAIWTTHQRSLHKQQGKLDGGDTARLVEQVELLQDRVQVLERIVTDRGYDLASQIEYLRDSRQIEQSITTNASKETNR